MYIHYKAWYLLLAAQYSRANEDLLKTAKCVACYRCKRLVQQSEIVYGTEDTGNKGFFNGAKTGIHSVCHTDSLLPSEVFKRTFPVKRTDFLDCMYDAFFVDHWELTFGKKINTKFLHDPQRKTLRHPAP